MLNAEINKAILEHYKRDYPREQCGFIIDNAYVPVRNISTQLNSFEIDPMDYLQATKLGKIKALVHSHPDGSTDPSKIDKIQMQSYDFDWVITNGIEIAVHSPEPFKLPLLGREYRHGLVDCYTIWKDYYERELGIIMQDYKRDDNWWDNPDSDELYLDNYKAEGFVEVSIDDIQKHDVMLCKVGRTDKVNHAAIFIGDGKLTSEDTPPVYGSNLILHHPYDKLSVREIAGSNWQSRTALVIRHRSLL